MRQIKALRIRYRGAVFVTDGVVAKLLFCDFDLAAEMLTRRAAWLRFSATALVKLSALQDESRRGLDGSYKPLARLYQSNKFDLANQNRPAPWCCRIHLLALEI